MELIRSDGLEDGLGELLGGSAGASSLDGLLLSLLLADNSSIRVELVHELLVGQGVLLLASQATVDDGRADDGLDFRRVDETGKVSIGHLSTREDKLGLEVLGEQLVQVLKGGVSPDDEATDVTTRGELEKVESVDVDQVNTRDVAEGTGEGGGLLTVDDKRTTALDKAAVAGLTLTGADLLAGDDTLDISVGTDLLEQGDGLLSLHDTSNVGDNERDLRHILDLVTTGLDESRDSGGSESRGNGVSALSHADLSVPAAPDLGGREHTTLAAHVTESTLSSAASTRTTNTRDTSDGTSSTPRHGRSLLTSVLVNSVGLTRVLADVGVDELNHILTDGSSEHGRQGNRASSGAGRGVVDGNSGTSSLDEKIIFGKIMGHNTKDNSKETRICMD